MFYVISTQGEKIASENSFTDAVYELILAPKEAQIFNENIPTGITHKSEAIQLMATNPYLRVCDAFETVKVAKENDCSLLDAAIHILNLERSFIGSDKPCTTEVLQYAGSFGIKEMFLTPTNKWK